MGRRAVLQGMGLGLAAIALGGTTARAATLTTSTPTPTWTYRATTDQFAWGAGFGRGAVVLLQKGLGTLPPQVSSVDVRTGQQLWQQTLRGVSEVTGPLVTPKGVLVASYDTSGRVFCLDPATGAIRWTVTVPGAPLPFTDLGWQPPLAADGSSVYVLTMGGYLLALSLTDGSVRWKATIPVITQAYNGYTNPVVGGGLVLVTVGGTLIAVSSATGVAVKEWQSAALQGHYEAQPTLGAGTLCVPYLPTLGAGTAGAIAAFSTRAEKFWTAPATLTNGQRFGTPAIAGGVVLAGDNSGGLSAFDLATGAQTWKIGLGSQYDLTGSTIVVDDGIAYVAGTPNGGTGTLFAVDLASQGAKVVTFATGLPGAQVVGVEAGVCYYANLYAYTQGTLAGAVPLASVLHGYFAQSQLMADDYVQGTSGAQPSTPTWRSHLQLLDATGTPRAGKSVRVWTDTAATLTSDGRTYPISPTQPAWLTTDAAGELALTLAATSKAAAAAGRGIGCAALYVWGSFMEPGEAIVLYPDHDTMTSLSTVQGSRLTAARTYAGAPMLPTGYTSSDADQLATAVRNTMGLAGSSLAATAAPGKGKRKANGGRGKGSPPPHSAAPGASPDGGYIAYPDSVTNLLYQPTIGPTGRTYVPSPVPAWTATISGGKLSYAVGASRGPKGTPPKAGGLVGDFEAFLREVVHDADQVASIIWKGVQDAAQEIVSLAGKTYRFIVKTVEQAAAVVAGILKAVVGDLAKVVEALSFVLSWDTIVANHRQLKGQVTTAFTGVKQWAAKAATSNAVPALFNDVATTVGTAFTQAENAIAGTSTTSGSPTRTNPAGLYSMGGARSYTPTRWMTEKVKTQAAATTTSTTLGAAGPGSPFTATLTTLATTIKGQLESSFAHLPSDLRALFADLLGLVKDPSQFGSLVIADLLKVLADLITGVIRFAGALAGDVVTILGTLIDGVLAALVAPIDIPVLSSLYKVVSGGSTMSILDLACLVVAIPATLISEALALSSTALTAQPSILDISHYCAMGIYAIIDSVADAFAAASSILGGGTGSGLMSLTWCAFATVSTALGFPADIATNTTANYVFFAMQAIPLVLGIVSAFRNDENWWQEGKVWPIISALAQLVYAIVGIAVSIALAVKNTTWLGKDGLVLVQNLLTFIPDLFKLILLTEVTFAPAAALVAIDAVCDLGAMGVAIAVGKTS